MPEQLIPDHLRPNVKEVAFQATHPEWSKPDFMTFAKPKDGTRAVSVVMTNGSSFVVQHLTTRICCSELDNIA